MKMECEAWLLEHLFYEWSMLNYTIGQLQKLPPGKEYNVHHESFAVHARLTSIFLTNGDTGNYGAKDFVRDFRSRKPDRIISLYNKIDPQVLHLSPKRTGSKDEKLNSRECLELFGWLRSEFDKFHSQIPDDIREKWNNKNSSTVAVQASSPSATNDIRSTTSTFVASVHTVLKGKPRTG